MKLSGRKIEVNHTPLQISGSLNVTGGTVVQFFDGNNYYPNREGTPSSPILLTHEVDVVDPDGKVTEFEYTTKFYENEVLITAGTSGYTIIGNSLRVDKNIPAGSVAIRAFSELLDPRSGKVYQRDDQKVLRTLLKSESPYQMELSPRGAIYFDAYRNPNQKTTIETKLKKNGEDITDYSDIVFKWLNPDGKDVIENELYGEEITGRVLEIDRTYIDHELIRCEAWIGDELIAFDTVTYIRKFNSFQADVRIPESHLMPGVESFTCSISMTDHLGNIDVDQAFLVEWYVSEDGVERVIGTGATIQVPTSMINLNAPNLSIYPDVKRREAHAALITIEGGEEYLITDDDDNVLTVETFGI